MIQGFAPHIVCAWIGNTEAVANKHYFQVPDSEFERAAKARPAEVSTPAPKVESALQNPVQYAAVSARIEPALNTETLVFAEKYEGLPYCTNEQAPRQGLEQPQYSSTETKKDDRGEAKAEAILNDTLANPLLMGIIEAWPRLPESIRTTLATIARMNTFNVFK